MRIEEFYYQLSLNYVLDINIINYEKRVYNFVTIIIYG